MWRHSSLSVASLTETNRLFPSSNWIWSRSQLAWNQSIITRALTSVHPSNKGCDPRPSIFAHKLNVNGFFTSIKSQPDRRRCCCWRTRHTASRSRRTTGSSPTRCAPITIITRTTRITNNINALLGGHWLQFLRCYLQVKNKEVRESCPMCRRGKLCPA